MATAEFGPRPWQSSLYARAALFLALGAASFVGAIVVLSGATVEESVDRLLSERLELARTVGAFVEARLLGDLDRLCGVAASPTASAETLATALASERAAGGYNLGAVALDPRGEPVAELPPPSGVPLRDFRLRMLAAKASHQPRGRAVSQVLLVGEPPRPALAVVRKLDAPSGSVHFVAGLLSLDRGDVLGPLLRDHAKPDTVIDLVDSHGVVAASTAPGRLALPGDHGDVLARAIAEQRGLRGRCHGCHGDPRAVTQARVQNVLAFSSLPTLALGIAVLQPERDALAPAFALQRRLLGLGASFVALFLIFAGLSVRSVVDPVKRLTRAMRQLDSDGSQVSLPTLGRDEVGELASTLARWHTRMRESLQRAEESQAALHAEMESTRQILQALEAIAGLYTAGLELPGIVDRALASLRDVLGYPCGGLQLRLAATTARALHGVEPEQWEELVQGPLAQLPAGPPERASEPRFDSTGTLLVLPLDYQVTTRFGVVGRHSVPGGVSVEFALLGRAQAAASQNRWLASLVHHIGIAATTRILHDREAQHTRQQERLLHQVLRAQEDERRRIARDLHDTVAQDLAALRLQLERLTLRADAEPLRQALTGVEQHTAKVLAAVRRTLFDLRLTVLENVGFVATLQSMLERLERDHGVRGLLAVHGAEREPPYEMAVALVRITQEALQNVVLHAKAHFVSLTVTFRPTAVELLVEDDGEGFDVSAVQPASGHGFGTLGMLERARLVGGELQVESTPGEGTSVSVRVPLWSGETDTSKELS